MVRHLRDHGHLLAVIALFCISRGILFNLTDPFDARSLSYALQWADIELLRSDLISTVYHLHSEPPLLNLCVGIILKLFPAAYPDAMAVCVFALDLVFAICFFELLRLLTIPKTLALVITTLFTISPQFIVHENWLSYEPLSKTFLCAITLFFCRFLKQRKLADAFWAVSGATLLTLSVNGFHYLWFLGLVVALCFFARNRVRKVLVLAALPIALVVGVHLKNLLVFGHFSVGTYLVAENLAQMSVRRIPDSLRMRLVGEGKLHKISLLGEFPSPDDVLKVAEYKPTGVRVLDDLKKSGFPTSMNQHHMVYANATSALMEDVRYSIRHYPFYYFTAVKANVVRLFQDLANNSFKAPDYPKLAGYNELYNLLAYGPPPRHLLQTLGLLVSLAWGFVLVYRGLRRRISSVFAASCGFMVVNIVGLNLGMVLCVPMDQNRFRYRTDALSQVFLALLIVAAYRLARRLWMGRNLELVQRAQYGEAATGTVSGRLVKGQQSPGIELLVDGLDAKDGIARETEGDLGHEFRGDPSRHLDEIRKWLQTDGEAIGAGRPWDKMETMTTEGGRGRVSAMDDALFVVLLDPPEGQGVARDALDLEPRCTVVFLGRRSGAPATAPLGTTVTIKLAKAVAGAEPHVFKVAGKRR